MRTAVGHALNPGAVLRAHDPIQITGKRGNAVLVSEDDWKAISETIQLSAIPGMVGSIKKGMKEENDQV